MNFTFEYKLQDEENFKISVGDLGLGWTFETRPKWVRWPFRPAPNGRQPPETGGRLGRLQRVLQL